MDFSVYLSRAAFLNIVQSNRVRLIRIRPDLSHLPAPTGTNYQLLVREDARKRAIVVWLLLAKRGPKPMTVIQRTAFVL